MKMMASEHIEARVPHEDFATWGGEICVSSLFALPSRLQRAFLWMMCSHAGVETERQGVANELHIYLCLVVSFVSKSCGSYIVQNNQWMHRHRAKDRLLELQQQRPESRTTRSASFLQSVTGGKLHEIFAFNLNYSVVALFEWGQA